MTVARELSRYLGSLVLAGGDHDGEPFTVLPWERRFIRGAFGQPGHSALSVARANGKTALVAGIAAAVVDVAGPLHGNRRECVCVASSFDQGKLIFEDVLAFLRARYDLTDRRTWRIQDSANRAIVEYRATGARVRTIGSDPAKAHGLRPALALLDEPAQWDSAKSDRMVAAIRTGLGKVRGSKMIALGTAPAGGDDHWFGRMLAGVGVGYAQIHAARPGDPDFHWRTIRRANPSVDHLPSLAAELREEVRIARTDAAMLQAWRALRLNGGVSDVQVSVLLEAGTWKRITGDAPRAGRCVWGLDLGQSESMAEIAAYWPESGRLESIASFPTVPSLAERGLQDGVGALYRRMEECRELITTGGEAVDIAELVRAARDRFGPPAAIAADRWRADEVRDILKRVRLPVVPFEERGQGFRDGGECVRTFRRACAEGAVTPAPSLLLTAAAGEARVIGDPAGNWKLAKATQAGRRRRAKDDAIAVAILAVSLGCRRKAAPRRPMRSLIIG